MSNVSDLKIISMNVCGFGNKIKRASIVGHLERFKPDILCLTDTRLDDNSELILRNELDYHCYFNSFASNARGVATLINKRSPIKVEKCLKDNTGNWLILTLEFESKIINLINIYGPNEDNPLFFTNMFDQINVHNLFNGIICGDFNTTLDVSLDNKNYVGLGNIRARREIIQLMSDFNFFDTYRQLNGNKKKYTWL